MSEQFYHDFGNPEVERLARAICVKRGISPDGRVRDNGYANSPLIPTWWKFQDRALDFLAMREATTIPPS